MPAKLSGNAVDTQIRNRHGDLVWMKDPDGYRGIDAKQVFVDNRFGEFREFVSTPYEVRNGGGAPIYRTRLALKSKKGATGNKVRVYTAEQVSEKVKSVTSGRVKMKDESRFFGVCVTQVFIETLSDGTVFEFECRPRDLMSGKQIGAPQLKGERAWKTRGGPKWTTETLSECAKRYSTRRDFRAGEPSAYQSAKSRGLLDRICGHMERLGNRQERVVYAIEYPETREVYVGLSFDPKARFEAHRTRGLPRVQEIIKSGARLKILTKILDKDDAAMQEASGIKKYEKRKWTILNRHPAGALGGNERKWTESDIRNVASKCQNKSEFYFKYPGARVAMKRLGIEDKIKAMFPENASSTIEGKRKNARSQGGKPFVSLLIEDNSRQQWETLSECAEALGLDRSDICAVLKGRKSKTRGYRFEYGFCSDQNPSLARSCSIL